MNKSLALKNKLYLFFSLVFVFLIFLYLIYFLIDPGKGVISYYKLKNKQLIYKTQLNELKIKNDLFILFFYITKKLRRLSIINNRFACILRFLT